MAPQVRLLHVTYPEQKSGQNANSSILLLLFACLIKEKSHNQPKCPFWCELLLHPFPSLLRVFKEFIFMGLTSSASYFWHIIQTSDFARKGFDLIKSTDIRGYVSCAQIQIFRSAEGL